MKKILLGTVLGILANNAVAEKLMLPMDCYPLNEVESLISYSLQTTGFVGLSTSSDGTEIITMVVRNHDTGAWTNMLINTSVDAACVVSFGEGFEFIDGGEDSVDGTAGEEL